MNFPTLREVSDCFYDLWYTVRRPYYRIKLIIKNLIAFRKVILGDCDWDQTFFLEVMETKLRKMYKYYSSGNAMSACALKQSKKILVCAELCKRLRESNYTDYYYRNSTTNWTFTPCEDRPGLSTLDISGVKEESIFGNVPEGFVNKYEDSMRKQDYDLLFKLLKKHLDTWWD